MYARSVGERELTFQVSGMLWQRSLVMRDIQTKSLWSHLLGKSMRGPLEGTELKVLPSTLTSWQEWRARHPGTTLLGMSRTAQRFDESVWRNPDRFVYGIRLGAGQASPAVALRKLMKAGVINLDAAGRAVVVTFAAKGKRAQAFERAVGEGVERFEPAGEGRMKDLRTGSSWDAVTGECVAGELKGRKLARRPGMVSYRRAWKEFYPDAKVVE